MDKQRDDKHKYLYSLGVHTKKGGSRGKGGWGRELRRKKDRDQKRSVSFRYLILAFIIVLFSTPLKDSCP